MQTPTAEVVLERMFRAGQLVRERLLRATAALEAAGVPYAVVGDQAVAAWVATVDESAVRNSPEVGILIRRADLATARDAFDAGDRDSIEVAIVGEKRRPSDVFPNPDVDGTVSSSAFKILDLHPLVVMCLSSFRSLDQLRIRDLIDVGLIDDTWPDWLPPELADRLRTILANPDG
jgi:hypothetical protein